MNVQSAPLTQPCSVWSHLHGLVLYRSVGCVVPPPPPPPLRLWLESEGPRPAGAPSEPERRRDDEPTESACSGEVADVELGKPLARGCAREDEVREEERTSELEGEMACRLRRRRSISRGVCESGEDKLRDAQGTRVSVRAVPAHPEFTRPSAVVAAGRLRVGRGCRWRRDLDVSAAGKGRRRAIVSGDGSDGGGDDGRRLTTSSCRHACIGLRRSTCMVSLGWRRKPSAPEKEKRPVEASSRAE